MTEVSFTGLLLVTVVAFAAPLLLGMLPRLRLPSVVLEIMAGIVIGPSVLGWVEPDVAIRILALVGLAFLLFLSGLEVELDRFRGRFLQRAVLGLVASLALSLIAGFALYAIGLVESLLFVAFIVAAAQIGMELGVISRATGAALVAAGLLSVLIFPPVALTVLRGAGQAEAEARDE